MTMHVHDEHGPPRTWQQFEEFCGDTFSALWSDPGLVRHGRGGQAQDGVDFYGKHGRRWPIGLQCKRKSKWPVARLTTAEIDKEVAAALKFKPKLKSFYILTTAPEDKNLLKHVREITAKHKRKKLFDVHLLGWQEIYSRATRYPEIADKHFGTGSRPREPLLDKWYASDHRLELKGTKLDAGCRELAHEFKSWPAGRIILRQRESDDLAAKIAAFNGRVLTMRQRKARLVLRDKLERLQEREAWISRGLRLLFGDPTITTWLFSVYKDTGDAPLAAAGWVNHELDPDRMLIKDGTVRLRVISPRDPDITLSHYISGKQVSSILELMAKRTKMYGPTRHTETVDELPEKVRASEAIPAIIHAILKQVNEGRSLEELRKAGVLEIGSWRFELG